MLEGQQMRNDKQQQESRTNRKPTLDSYRRTSTCMPLEPEVEMYVSRAKRTIYINTAAKPGANITKLIP